MCDQIELEKHQLLKCTNAARLWDMFQTTTGASIRTMYDIISCSAKPEVEIFKTGLIKALIQINRSRNKLNRVFALECAYYLRIEAMVNSRCEAKLLNLARTLQLIA